MTTALTPTASVPAADLQQIAPVDREMAVTQYLASARDWLARAVVETGPETIAQAKAEIATAAEATKQLGLSKEIQLDAQEMVRRAEFALGKAIRRAQQEGTVRSSGQHSLVGDRHEGAIPERNSSTAGVSEDFFNGSGQTQYETYQLSDGVEPEEFEAALTEAKDEGNLSRANVVRKVKGKKVNCDTGPRNRAVTDKARLDSIRDMAARGMTSKQMSVEMGHGDGYIRQLARDNNIEIPGDRITSRSRSLSADRALQQLVLELDSLAGTTEFIEVSAASRDHLQEWVNSLSDSLRALGKFANQLKKELTH